MKAWAQAVIATGIFFLHFLHMTLPKGTTETQGTSKAAHLGGRGYLKGQDSAKYQGMGPFRRIWATGWKESGVRILRSKAEDALGR